jgi:hypothetical protein
LGELKAPAGASENTIPSHHSQLARRQQQLTAGKQAAV